MWIWYRVGPVKTFNTVLRVWGALRRAGEWREGTECWGVLESAGECCRIWRVLKNAEDGGHVASGVML